jgi:hypothetical protein
MRPAFLPLHSRVTLEVSEASGTVFDDADTEGAGEGADASAEESERTAEAGFDVASEKGGLEADGED